MNKLRFVFRAELNPCFVSLRACVFNSNFVRLPNSLQLVRASRLKLRLCNGDTPCLI